MIPLNGLIGVTPILSRDIIPLKDSYSVPWAPSRATGFFWVLLGLEGYGLLYRVLWVIVGLWVP